MSPVAMATGPTLRPYTAEEVDALQRDLNRFAAWDSRQTPDYHARPFCSRGGSRRCRHLPFYVATLRTAAGKPQRLTLCPKHGRMFAETHGLDFPEIEV